jgi:hypothetical protein
MERPIHQTRELTRNEMERFLKKKFHGRLGLCVENEPYVVPVSYRYSEGQIYFHTAINGKKIDFMNKNDRICFESDEWEEGWASVICYGKVTLRDDLETKKYAFKLLTGQDLPEERIKHARIYIGIIDIEEMTGRCSTDFKFS